MKMIQVGVHFHNGRLVGPEDFNKTAVHTTNGASRNVRAALYATDLMSTGSNYAVD